MHEKLHMQIKDVNTDVFVQILLKKRPSSNMFCAFLLFFHSVLVKNLAISSSDSRERHFFVHSRINN